MKKTPPAEHLETMRRLAGTIYLLRISEDLSLRDFAEKAGVSHADVFRLENGLTRNPSVYLINRIAMAFGLTIDQLMSFDVRECPTCKGAGWVKNE